jgi:hypothetical protein
VSYRGIVIKGVVVLKEGEEIPDGTEVRVEPVVRNGDLPAVGPTLAEQFANVAGTVPELPTDIADQHDHYLHGASKR